MHLTNVFTEFSLVLVIVLAVLIIIRYLRQPLIIGYIVSAIIVSPLFLGSITEESFFEPLAKIGIALLLFMVGLDLNPLVIKNIRKIAFVIGIGQIIFTFSLGLGVGILLGFDLLTSIYLAVAISFSSTIVIMKMLSDNDEKDTLHGRVSIGSLLVQDLIHIMAIIALLALGRIIHGAGVQEVAISTIGWTLLMGFILLFSGFYILPAVTRFFAKSQELLLFFSIGWALFVATIFSMLNLSFEVGALLAGVVLSLSPYRYEIISKTRPFRDFFLLVFFIFISTQIVPISLKEYLLPIILFSGLVLIGNPLIVMFIMGIMKFTKKNSFRVGLILAQISEFSLIIIGLGVQARHLKPEILSISVIIALITIAGSSYSFMYFDKLYRIFSRYLSIFERKGHKIDIGKHYKDKKYDTILFGHNRIGYSLLKSLKKTKNRFLVVDYNPDTIKCLAAKGVPCRYGDADDLELLEELPLAKAKTIISTIPEKEINTILIDYIKGINPEANIIVVSHSVREALEMYKLGATYVITPHFLGGEHVAHLIEEFKEDKKKFEEEGKKAKKELVSRWREGHGHD